MLNRFRQLVFRRRLGSRGVTLINVLVGSAVLATVILAGLNLTSSVHRAELDAEITSRMLLIRENLIAFIENDEAWERTVLAQNATIFNCIYNHTDCSANFATYQNFDLYYPDGTLYYAPVSVPTQGFSQKVSYNSVSGQHNEVCTGFNSTNRDCLYRVTLSYRPVCPDGTTLCRNPKVEIRGQFSMAAITSAGMPNWRIYKERYDFTHIRSSEKGYHLVILRDQHPSGELGGTSSADTWLPRCFNRLDANIVDTGSNIIDNDGTATDKFAYDATYCASPAKFTTTDFGTTFKLRAGVYRCEFSAPAYQVNTHRARLYNVTRSEVLIEGSTEDSRSNDTNLNLTIEQTKLMTRSSGSGQFTLNQDSDIRLEHWAERTLAVTFGSALRAFGMASSWGNEIYSVLKCIKEI